MALRLNIQESSIRKKRGKSFFNENNIERFALDEEGNTTQELVGMIDQSQFMRQGEVGTEPHSSVYKSSAALGLLKGKSRSNEPVSRALG